MSTSVAVTNRLLTNERDAEMAREVLDDLVGPAGQLAVGQVGSQVATPLPPELGVILQQVLRAVAEGSSVTVTSIPKELTTSSAAAMLGMSRPTLMRLVAEGHLPAHKVGSHTRLLADDVVAYRKARRARERAAFAELLELEGDEV
ncbi:helix-turn-helix domain-containing protein [Cellulomonas citrea]|uniref:helix-turn-helix domain-containing protein n=1 Tax=Cellulomonas citrea TaxID=1909423 RepID=UPI00135985B6|nr:helix-turn-helix domain-containing protein [Cellulomonas citrea]